MRTCLAVVLAAGEGTRMKSRLPKVLHPIAHLPMIAHVLRAVAAGGADRIAVVIGPDHGPVADAVARHAPGATIHVQHERLGTAHAVLAAREALAAGCDDLLVVFGDTPFVSPATIARVRAPLGEGAAIVVGGMVPDDPTGYGRLIVEEGQLVAIREHKDASEAERAIPLCNGGVMALRGALALDLLESVGNRNAQGEYYLTDAVAIANGRGLRVAAVEIAAAEVFGINTRAQLGAAERLYQDRRRADAMAEGATLLAPETVHFAHDTRLGRDVTIGQNVVFAPGVEVEDDVEIRAFCHIEGARIRSGALVGPFARLRPGADVGEGVHVGNFCEIKNAVLDAGVKVNHLTYIGDAHIGAGTNIGAGTITCNYDGVYKHHTEIGRNAFIGSNSALVAPVTIGDGAYVASGSVITDDVEPDALALGRARQVVKPGWAAGRPKKGG
ncbi:bifunctional UDP-N-acetylglucosamine diphosphorylase/glucosamine-1-phosphate N-acetyltransferase GlmU [Propylenella binzhouense]|uniref:Bifunctional protein GlmU n=1 Tax=Propylenella binzhouense TaxID=2555902 RepID=A0A964T2K9_9HYPH|nr:bifunctional UDP-N-acetylglucosamine diphosphorylase/glucosamine-1-phosphate N-acetyltransferase GlmU [Propylenella binzhouense]MYZ47318.1 bifunctional UDP-N-acetylglucosamine diphosphorylase/glucosamine-1-phosphate N-acetyltransferase GlmU [Propylenella binzhouense]